MSDLISGSALLKCCRKVVEYDEAGYSVTFNAVSVEDIKNEPTVEAVPKEKIQKVLEQLEEEKSDWNDDYNVPINKAIAIVKEVGGVND